MRTSLWILSIVGTEAAAATPVSLHHAHYEPSLDRKRFRADGGGRKSVAAGSDVTTDRRARLAAATDHLRAHGRDGLVAASNGLNNFLDANAVFVLSGVRAIGASAVVLDRDGRSVLIVTPAWDEGRAAAESLTDTTIGTDDLAGAIADVATAHHLDLARTIAVDLSLLGIGMLNRIGARLGTIPKAVDELARDLARIRSPEEIEAAVHATMIAERGYERLKEIARPGLREFELAADLYCYMKGLGAEDNFLLLSASQHNQAVRAAGERILDIGDIILSEITPCYRGQFVQICRTTVIGALPRQFRKNMRCCKPR